MTDETGGENAREFDGDEPEESKEQPDRLAKARAVKAEKRKVASGMVTLTQDQFGALMARINSLESQKQEVSITTATPGAPRTPGSLVKIGGEDRKVRWTKADIEREYPPVTFTPIESLVVGPHGQIYELSAGVEFTGPSIVKSVFDEALANRKAEGGKYRPIGLQEQEALAIRAQEAPGQPVWSRLFRSPGSLFMNRNEGTEPKQ